MLHEYGDSPITNIVHLKHHGKGQQELVAVSNAKGEVAIWDMQDLEMDFECEIHEKGEIKSMIELQSGKYQGYLLTGGDDFSFKLVRIREDQHEYEIISSYGARGPVQSICQLWENRVAISDNNIVQIWDLDKTTNYVKEVIYHEDQVAVMLTMDNGEYVLSVGRD